MVVPSDQDAIAFGERLLALLDEGAFTATYKYAVLLGLMDLCIEHVGKSGEAPTVLSTTQLAERVVELYWPHTIQFEGARVLQQNTRGQAEILQLIQRFRERHAADPTQTIGRARRQAPEAFAVLVRDVEWKLIEMPLPRLQQIGVEDVPFVYRIGWDRSVRRGEVNDAGFDNRIHLVGRAGDHLVRLAGLLRPLVQRQWSSMVARLNKEVISDSELDDFLFGHPRISLAPVAPSLRELQDNRCFYCDRAIAGPTNVDHFLPWARYPDNGIENLVVADAKCNNSKRDFLAAPDHLGRWVGRFAGPVGHQLQEIATAVLWDRHPEQTHNASRAIYLRLPSTAKLWERGRTFVDANRDQLVAVLST